MFLAEH